MSVEMSKAAYERVVERLESDEHASQVYEEQLEDIGATPEPVTVELQESCNDADQQYSTPDQQVDNSYGDEISDEHRQWHRDVMSQY